MIHAKSRSLVLIAGVAFLAAGLVAAVPVHMLPEAGLSDPGNLPATEMNGGVQNVTSLLQNNWAAHAAANENVWFRSPSVFAEYTYTDSRDRALTGFTSHTRNGTVGLNFLTFCDVAVSLAGTYGGTAADTAFPGHIINNAENYGLSLTVAKNIDWFLFGFSSSYNGGDSRTRTPVGNILKSEPCGESFAPFVGAMYSKGNLSLSSVTAYMYNWNWVDYDSTGVAPADDHFSQETFAWMNTASYKICEKMTVSLLANWNRLTHYKKLTNVPSTVSDREWLTFGPKLTYRITPTTSAYVSCTKDLGSGTFDTLQALVGVNYGF